MSPVILLFPDWVQIEVMTSYDSSGSLLSALWMHSMLMQTPCVVASVE